MVVSDGFSTGNMCSSHYRRSSICPFGQNVQVLRIHWICPCCSDVEHTGRPRASTWKLDAQRGGQLNSRTIQEYFTSSPPHRKLRTSLPHLHDNLACGNIGFRGSLVAETPVTWAAQSVCFSCSISTLGGLSAAMG